VQEIGYWIHVDHVRRQLATRSAAALTEAGFALPDVGRIEIHHDVANVISGRVPSRLGYVRLREEPAASESSGGSGIHVIWAMDRDAWAVSSGAALLADVRAQRLSPDPTR
jgi:ribosomal-protein-serine acetyltransferase